MPARDVATALGYSPTSGTTQASNGNGSLAEEYLPRIKRITRMKSQAITYFAFSYSCDSNDSWFTPVLCNNATLTKREGRELHARSHLQRRASHTCLISASRHSPARVPLSSPRAGDDRRRPRILFNRILPRSRAIAARPGLIPSEPPCSTIRVA